MGRKRTGSITLKGGIWYAQLTVNTHDGGTRELNLPMGGIPAHDRAAARRRCDELNRRAQRKTYDPAKRVRLKDLASVSFEQYLERWIEWRKAQGLETWAKDEQRLTDHVLELLKGKPMASITEEDIKRVVLALDQKVRNPSVRFGWKTARNTWEALTKLFKDARNSKDPDLCVIKVNPCLEVEGPDAGSDKDKQWLYPAEFSAFIACEDVPLIWRQAAALATYLYLRIGELRALRCEDIDLVTGMVRVHQSVGPDQRTGGEKVRQYTKTGSIRHFVMEPVLVPLVRALYKAAGGRGPLLRLSKAQADKASRVLRAGLKRALVKREALHTPTSQSAPITFHDLRATGITWAALRDDPALEIRDRAGHADIKMTDHYMRRRASSEVVGEPFPPLTGLLPAELAGSAPSGPGIHSARRITRGALSDSVRLMVSNGYEVEPRGIESPAAPPITGKDAESATGRCDRCGDFVEARNIPRNILSGETRSLTRQASPAAWALHEAAARLLAPRPVAPRPPAEVLGVAVHAGQAPPARPGKALESAVHGGGPLANGGRDVG